MNVKIFKMISFLIIIVVLICITYKANTPEKRVVLVTDIQVPYSGPSLMNNGFFTEIVKEVFERAGYICDIKYMSKEKAF